MPKSKKKIKGNHLIYFFNFLLIFSVITLRILDIYFTLILIEDSRVTETIPLSQFILTLGPVASYLISTLPFVGFFLVNYYIREKAYYLIGFSIVLGIIIICLIPPVQNSLNILRQM